jgi:molecular chaperone DnaK (HSP70)
VARPKKTLSPEEIKAQRENLRAVLKQVTTQRSEAEKAKVAASRALAAAQKSAEKAVKDAAKAFEATAKKADKAIEAANKGEAKIMAQLNALAPAPKAPKVEATA